MADAILGKVTDIRPEGVADGAILPRPHLAPKPEKCGVGS
jgi:hypothetical protein